MKRNPPRPTPGGEWSQDTLCIWVIRLTSTWRRPVAPRLGFLGASLFGFGTSAFEPWILLDFLGFSRSNRAFSMGYAAKRSEHFFLPLRPCRRKCEEGRLRSWRSEAQDSPSGKLNSFSDFLQEIAGSYSVGAWSANNGSATASWPRLSRPSTPTRAKPQVVLLEKLIISDDYARLR